VQYLCTATKCFLREPITPERVVHSFSGVRALLDDGHVNPSAVTRDYALLLEHAENAPLLSMVGGKLTTYRVLAEKTLDQLRRYFPTMSTKSWTGNEPLPGGDLSGGGMVALCAQLEADYPHLPAALLAALAGRHGTLAAQVLGEADRESQLGVHFGGGLYAREVDYLIDHEWVRSAHDVLWRRTKTGLSVDPESSSALDEYVRTRVAR
jgi:glycerol-3-phosphate dehydrogenase